MASVAMKNYIQFDGNKVVAYSTLIAFDVDSIPDNLTEAGDLAVEDVIGKYYNPVDGRFYSKYNWKSGVYSD